LNSLGKSYQDNQAVLQYELQLQALEAAEKLLQEAPRPILVNNHTQEGSVLTTLLMAQILPQIMKQAGNGTNHGLASTHQSIASHIQED